MRTWKVKTKGRIEHFLLVFILPIFLELWGIELPFLSNLDWFEWIFILFFTSFLWIPFLTVFVGFFFNKKVPNQIIVNKEKQICTIIFSKKNSKVIPFENLAYTYSDKNFFYNSITLYLTFSGTRGQVVTNKITEIFGFKFTFSWKKRQVSEINQYLFKNEILIINNKSADLPLWEKMISD